MVHEAAASMQPGMATASERTQDVAPLQLAADYPLPVDSTRELEDDLAISRPMLCFLHVGAP